MLKDSNESQFKYGDMKIRIPRKIKKKLKVGCTQPVKVVCSEISAGSGRRCYGKYSFAIEFKK